MKTTCKVNIRLPAPAATGEAARPASCAAEGWGERRQATGRRCNQTVNTRGRSQTGHFLRNGQGGDWFGPSRAPSGASPWFPAACLTAEKRGFTHPLEQLRFL